MAATAVDGMRQASHLDSHRRRRAAIVSRIGHQHRACPAISLACWRRCPALLGEMITPRYRAPHGVVHFPCRAGRHFHFVPMRRIWRKRAIEKRECDFRAQQSAGLRACGLDSRPFFISPPRLETPHTIYMMVACDPMTAMRDFFLYLLSPKSSISTSMYLYGIKLLADTIVARDTSRSPLAEEY